MSVRVTFLSLGVFFGSLAVASEALPNQLVHYDAQTGLKGWKNQSTEYSENRITPLADAFAGGVVFTTLVRDKGFSDGMKIALAREGISDVSVLSAKRFAPQQMAQVNELIFSDPTLDIYWFVAEGKKDGLRMKIAGHAITTPPHSKDPEQGTNFEVFVAPEQIYNALGGWLVPAARYYDLYIDDPTQVMEEYGQMSAEESVDAGSSKLTEWMSFQIKSKAMIQQMQGMTLQMNMGLGAWEGYGTDDPMYDW